MSISNIVAYILSFIAVIALAGCITWICLNPNAVQDGLSGANLYTQEEMDKACEDAYNTALSDKDSYITLINSLRDEKIELTDELSKANLKVNDLTNDNIDKQQQIDLLTTQKNELSQTVENLESIKVSNEATITNLESQKELLEQEVLELQASNTNQATLIEQKNLQIENLQNTITQLQTTINLNTDTINDLNLQIESLNKQISSMSVQIQNNSINVTALNNKIAELEQSVSYYEQYIANLENGEQVVATFEFAGSVYNIQIVSPNSTLSVADPTSTEYVIFNYWMIDNEQIDLSTYKITANTKIVANVTYKYDVKFMVDEVVCDTQIVVKNDYATSPTTPTKDDYEFIGWSINGVDIVAPDTIAITQHTTFVAKFAKLQTVTFMLEDVEYESQSVKFNNYAIAPASPSKTGYDFAGWSINGVDIIDITTFNITYDVIFVAVFNVHMYTVTISSAQYMGTTLGTKLVAYNNTIGDIDVVVPAKQYHTHTGWARGTSAIDLATYVVTSDINIYPTYIQTSKLLTFTDNGNVLLSVEVVLNKSLSASLQNLPTPYGMRNCVFVGWFIDNSTILNNDDIMSWVPTLSGTSTLLARYVHPASGTFATTGGGKFFMKFDRVGVTSWSLSLNGTNIEWNDTYTEFSVTIATGDTYLMRYDADNDKWIGTCEALGLYEEYIRTANGQSFF